MDTREQISAANALIEWFNSQEVSPIDATLVMSKVLAKILTVKGGDLAVASSHDLVDIIDAFTFQLVDDVNERLYNVRRNK
jgi:hypothetical protein